MQNHCSHNAKANSKDNTLSLQNIQRETLRCRAFAYCSSETLVKAELLHLQKVFIENGYPTNLVLQFLSLQKRKEKKQKKKDLETQEEVFMDVSQFHMTNF